MRRVCTIKRLHSCIGNRLALENGCRLLEGSRQLSDEPSKTDDAGRDGEAALPAAVQAIIDKDDPYETLEERRKGKRPTRAEKGTWVDNHAFTDEMVERSPAWPANQPLYDVQSQVPWLMEPSSPVFEEFKALKENNPDEFMALLNAAPEEDLPPRPGARKILTWETNVVFEESQSASREPHPLNKKAKCRVYLRDLQQEFQLSEQALQYCALLCGPRYNPQKGLLTLTSEKYPQREDNRLHIVETLHKLLSEVQQKYPNDELSKEPQQATP